MQPAQYFTKSNYRTALECPTKLYFQSRPETYLSLAADDPFLKALQDGGFQVGELARLYHPDGILVDAAKTLDALRETKQFMQREKVVLFEAAFEWNGLLVRADVLVKDGNRITLKEVKSKAFNPAEDSFVTRKGTVSSDWKTTIAEVAFQTHVIRHAVPYAEVEAYLVLCDKSAQATVDGLNTMFRVERGKDGRPNVQLMRKGVTEQDLGARLLHEENVTAIIDEMISTPAFQEEIARYSLPFLQGRRPEPVPIGACHMCEYRVPKEKLGEGQVSGFDECWRAVGLTAEELEQPLVVDIGNRFRKGPLLERGIYLMRDVTQEDLSGTLAERHWRQILMETDPEQPAEWYNAALFAEMDRFTYPLHFIDFETAAVAIPFYAGQRPYQTVAFQFSCHKVHADGRVEHSHEWIQPKPGRMPNVAFVRALRAALGDEGGTVFRYSHHENTVLNEIYEQLEAASDAEVSDRAELMEWIRTLTRWDEGKKKVRGERCMIDQCELVQRYYYHRDMKGSNSIKRVLPAVLGQSDTLRRIYSEPYYGTNFQEGIVWWALDEETGRMKDPYKLLTPLEGDYNDESEGHVANGGAAATAFAKMQYTEIPDSERQMLTMALLRYCELDTLAMVMIHQHWASLRARYNRA